MNTSFAPYLEGFTALPRTGESWLQALRQTALERAEARGFPGPRDEAWKYTSLAALEKRAFKPSFAKIGLDASNLAGLSIKGFDSSRAVFVNGRFRPDMSRLPKGVRALSLIEGGEAPRKLADVSSDWHDDTFLNLNTALFRDGLLLELDADAVLEAPLEILHISAPDTTPSSHHLRCIVRLGRGAKAMLVERYAGLDGAKNLTNAVMQVELEERSELIHARLQEESPQGFHVGRVLVQQAAGSNYLSHNLQLGGLWSRLDIHIRLATEGARAGLNGLYAVNGRQHIDNHTRVDHLAPGTVSRELYRGILDGQGRAVFNGQVVVAPHAVKTDAEQANHNLILSRGAEIDTKPELQIDADDVKCSHGASIGQLDEDQLFYLRSRGLDTAAAKGLLIAAFAERLMAALPHPALAAYARTLLGRSIAQLALPESP